MFQPLEMTWQSSAPLVMHNGQLANPMNVFAKEMKKVSSKRAKTDADYLQLARVEFLGGLYLAADGPVIPAECIEAVMIAGSKKLKRGNDAKSGIVCIEHASLEYEGPRTADELWDNEAFHLQVGVRVNTNRVIRTRPIFRKWKCTVKLEFEDEVLNKSDVIEFAKKAGQLVGLCEWRPKYGRFTVAL